MIKRYDGCVVDTFGDLWVAYEEGEDGGYVKYDDHAAELATLAVVCKQSLEREATLRAENERMRDALCNIIRSSVPAFSDDGSPITDDDGNLGMIYDNLYFNVAKEALK